MEGRRAASGRGPFIGSTSDRRSKFDLLALRPNQRKFTHYQGYHRQRLAFFCGIIDQYEASVAERLVALSPED